MLGHSEHRGAVPAISRGSSFVARHKRSAVSCHEARPPERAKRRRRLRRSRRNRVRSGFCDPHRVAWSRACLSGGFASLRNDSLRSPLLRSAQPPANRWHRFAVRHFSVSEKCRALSPRTGEKRSSLFVRQIHARRELKSANFVLCDAPAAGYNRGIPVRCADRASRAADSADPT